MIALQVVLSLALVAVLMRASGGRVRWPLALAMVAALVVSGCRPGSGYVAADRETFESVAPEYLAYVASDATLTKDQRELRERVVASWEGRIKQAESDPKANPEPAPEGIRIAPGDSFTSGGE